MISSNKKIGDLMEYLIDIYAREANGMTFARFISNVYNLGLYEHTNSENCNVPMSFNDWNKFIVSHYKSIKGLPINKIDEVERKCLSDFELVWRKNPSCTLSELVLNIAKECTKNSGAGLISIDNESLCSVMEEMIA